MARPTKLRVLGLWANGERVGHWVAPTRGPSELHYDADWMTSPVGRPLSLSLPFGVPGQPLRGPVVDHYFDNLLPDSTTIRQRLAVRFRTGTDRAFDLLAAVGRDCVGALQLLPEGESPTGFDTTESLPLDAAAVERHLMAAAGTAEPEVGHGDALRLSLAGAQEKAALLLRDGQWHHPLGATPTTHIFKMPLGLVGNRQADFRTSVDNEWLCLRLIAAFGLPVPQASVHVFGRLRVLVVERFDRRLHPSGRWWMRLPQEDFCQAFGLPSHMKYEADGGPGVTDICRLLAQSEQAIEDVRCVLKAQLLFWLLAAPDGHAKNFSLQLLPRGRFRLSPLYDVMSAYPVLGGGANQWSPQELRLAMAVHGQSRHYLMRGVMRRHFNTTARRCGLDSAEPMIHEVLAHTARALADVRNTLPGDMASSTSEAILEGFEQAVQRLERMPPD